MPLQRQVLLGVMLMMAVLINCGLVMGYECSFNCDAYCNFMMERYETPLPYCMEECPPYNFESETYCTCSNENGAYY